MTPERERLAVDNLRLIGRVVRDLIRLGTPVHLADEMRDEGQLGLCRAALSYDPALGVKFSTYAYACIKRSIIDYLRKSDLRNFDHETGGIKPLKMPAHGKRGTDQFRRFNRAKSWEKNGRPSRLDIPAIKRGLIMAGCP